jgi:hypothetical protein
MASSSIDGFLIVRDLCRRSSNTIHGFLFYSDNLINHWDFLDEFEGEEFIRMPIKAERFDEIEVDTYIYTLKDEIIEEELY